MYPYRKFNRYSSYPYSKAYQGGSSYTGPQNKRRRTASGYTGGVQNYTQSSSSGYGGLRRRYRTTIGRRGRRLFGRRRVVSSYSSPMATSIRNTMQKMGGLHVAQYTNTQVAFIATGTTQAATNTVTIGTADDFTVNWAFVVSGASNKVTLRAIALKSFFTNNSNTPVIMQYWLVKPSKISSSTLGAAMADGLTNYMDALIDPTQSNSFRRYFQVIGRGTRIIKAGACEMLTYNDFWPGGKAISGDIEGNTLFTPGVSAAYYCKFTTIPVEESSAGFLTTLGEVSINIANWKMATWYNIDNSSPTSKATGGITTGTAKIFSDKTEMAVDDAD